MLSLNITVSSCSDIRGWAQDWEITFEMKERDEIEHGAERYVKDLDDSNWEQTYKNSICI